MIFSVLHSSAKGIIFTVCMLLSISMNSGLQLDAIVERATINTERSKSENMLCSIPDDGEVRICWWTLSRFNTPNVIAEYLLYTLGNEVTNSTNFAFYGSGLQSGSCGLRISNIERYNTGFWNCSLISKKNNDIFQGSIKLNVTEKCTKPALETSALENIWIDSHTGEISRPNISCCLKLCGTIPKLVLLQDEVLLDESVYKLRIEEDDTYTCITWANAQFNFSDNGSKVQCEARYQNMTPRMDMMRDFSILDFKYPPRFHPDNESRTQAVTSHPEINITVELTGNPSPVITWSIQKIGESETFSTAVLNNGSKYTMYRTAISDIEKTWTASLLINNFEKHDLDYKYVLNATNQYGWRSIAVTLEEQHNWLLIVVAALVGVLCVGVISLLVWKITNQRQRRCSGGRSLGGSGRSPTTQRNSDSTKKSAVSYTKAATIESIPEEEEDDATVTDFKIERVTAV